MDSIKAAYLVELLADGMDDKMVCYPVDKWVD